MCAFDAVHRIGFSAYTCTVYARYVCLCAFCACRTMQYIEFLRIRFRFDALAREVRAQHSFDVSLFCVAFFFSLSASAIYFGKFVIKCDDILSMLW